MTAGDGNIEIICEFTTDMDLTDVTGEFNLSDRSYVNIISKEANITTEGSKNYVTGVITPAESIDLDGVYLYDFTITNVSNDKVTIRSNGEPGTITFSKNLKGV